MVARFRYINVDPQTWHYGLVAQWWAEFNDDYRAHEIDYYRAQVGRSGEPVLDAGCGAGRLLVPLTEDGFTVDGCDISTDMVAVCQAKAAARGFSPDLYVQALHELDLPRVYRTILVVGTYGLGSSRAQDQVALGRLFAHLEPGGTLLLDIEVPYADPDHWRYWVKDTRVDLPEPLVEPEGWRRAVDGSEYALSSRILDVDPIAQRVTMEMRAQRWRDGEIEAEETHTLTINHYFPHELVAKLAGAGFASVDIHGEHEERPPKPDDDFVVFVATK